MQANADSLIFAPSETQKDGANMNRLLPIEDLNALPARNKATIRGAQDGMRYLNFSELRAKLGNRSRSAIYNDLAAGRIPQPVKLGGRLYWPEGDVDAHLRDMRDMKAA